MNAIDLKTFLPARDFAVSRRFYVDLGFTETWALDQVAELQLGGFRFCCRTTTSRSSRRTS